jgi:hypothetical protein
MIYQPHGTSDNKSENEWLLSRIISAISRIIEKIYVIPVETLGYNGRAVIEVSYKMGYWQVRTEKHVGSYITYLYPLMIDNPMIVTGKEQ